MWAHAFGQKPEDNLWEFFLFYSFLGIELRSSGLVESALTYWNILLAWSNFHTIKKAMGLLGTEIWHYTIQKASDTAKSSEEKVCDKTVSGFALNKNYPITVFTS